MGGIFGQTNVLGGTVYEYVVLYEYAVEEYGEVAGAGALPVVVEAWGGEDDVVGIPLAGRAHGVYEGGVLLVYGARLAIRVGAVLVAVEDLYLVAILEEDTAVAAPLAFAFNGGRGAKLEVELAVGKGAAGFDVAGAFYNRHGIGFELPGGGFPVGVLPLAEVGAIKEDEGIGRRAAYGAGINGPGFGLPHLGSAGVSDLGHEAGGAEQTVKEGE